MRNDLGIITGYSSRQAQNQYRVMFAELKRPDISDKSRMEPGESEMKLPEASGSGRFLSSDTVSKSVPYTVVPVSRAEKARLIRITKWMSPSKTVENNSQAVSYEEWLRTEKERINKDPDRIAVIAQYRKGLVCLYVNGWDDQSKSFLPCPADARKVLSRK